MLEACVNLEPGVLEFEEHALFDTSAPVHILGRKYSARSDQDELRADLRSRLWMTYRRGFHSIGGTGPRSDEGWGCMLRCGQMLLAEAHLRLDLGRDWRWRGSGDRSYRHILDRFLDIKHRPYSLHQIAQMGVSEGKEVGEWFGPNTTAQVLKKLAALDSQSPLVIHVALDNCVIVDDLLQLCRSNNTTTQDKPGTAEKATEEPWRPLLLLVPLRLGLSSLNPCYIGALKTYLSLECGLGLLGGRPNHALWVVGSVEAEALYLDPHHCQDAFDPDDDDDSSFHQPFLLHQSLADLDPSLALAFLLPSRSDLDRFLHSLQETLLPASQPPLFEVLQHRPSWLPNFTPYSAPADHETPSPATFTQLDSDEEFEILD